MAQYTQSTGLSCIDDWGWSESQNDAPPAAGSVPARSAGPVCGAEYAKVTECAAFAPRSQVVTGTPALSSPVTPVRGFRIGLGGDDEHTLRQRLRMRAMAMADGLTPAMDKRPVGGYETSQARNAGSQHGSPGPSSVSSVNTNTMPSQQSGAPSAMLPVGHGSPRASSEPLCDGALGQQVSQYATSSEYVLNCIINDIEAGVNPTEHVDAGRDGGQVVASQTTPSDTPPRCGSSGGAAAGTPPPMSTESGSHHTPPRCPSSGGVAAGSPSPLTGDGCSHTPPTTLQGPGTSAGGPSAGHPPRPCQVEKNTDRWGETKTEWLCWCRNEAKALMGEETEAFGRARLKAGFWKYEEERMRAKGYNRADDQCKNKFNQILDYYRRLKAHERWSGLPSYWDMNQTRRKKYNVDFVLRRSWYDVIHPVEKDKDSINLSNLMDSGADEERLEDGEGVNDGDGEMDGDGGDPTVGSGSSAGGSRSTGFDPTLGKRKRTASNARESGVEAVTAAMRAHTTALTRSDLTIAKMRCEATRDIAKQQAELCVRAVAEFHDQATAGHMGFHKTLARVSRLYVWPKRKDFVKDYVAECPTCQEVNNANHLPYGLIQPLPIPEGRWQSILMDFIGPLRPPTPRSHDAILVVIDCFMKRAHFVPCRYAISARELADIVFDRVVRDHDLPLSIISDRDPRFTNRLWRRLHKVYSTHLHFSSSYHPQTNCQTEVTNMTLRDILRKIIRDDQQWDLHLAYAEIAYNHDVSLATGMSPYYGDLGYHPRVPADFLRPSQMHPDTTCPTLDDWVAHMTSIMKTAHEHIASSQTRMAAHAS
ncbi:hypothetical protein CBR_g29577 [Chara braunii]|uniref:Integrase catalytic domain-containing protein n=1 Tax=Chara braunii TaxID=69332 RepID=A0A388LAT7_CHABU|nr:hypothetical protein CBR_g29577 [Chara braunii]|eukprot:GBG79430.1 hypothetical protein CBR_g29577 [Chara braunii]